MEILAWRFSRCSNPSPSSPVATCSRSFWSWPRTRCYRASSPVTSSKAASPLMPLFSRARALRRRLDPLRLALCPLGFEPRLAACVLVLHCRGNDGHRRDHSQLEQGLASLVLVVLAAHLAGELLDRPIARPTPGGGCSVGSDSSSIQQSADPATAGSVPEGPYALVIRRAGTHRGLRPFEQFVPAHKPVSALTK